MQMTDLLAQMGGLDSMARQLGISKQQTALGVEALLPAILGGFKKRAQTQPTGLEGLTGLLGQLGGASLLEDGLSSHATNVNRGNDVLGQIFGSKDVSRAVAQNAASRSGLDLGTLKKMLPMLAMLVTGLMSRGQGSGVGPAPASGQDGLGGLLGNMLGGLLGGSDTGSQPAKGGLPGLASMLDMDGDGNPLDDILGMLGGGR
ncbi:MAG: DUF937 domain-containing protein [Thermoanaerobaculaceae bacterium]|nr:DUF937 domain-containing protein [Thermoanaerobaculaceae bacterium]MDI9622885.1 DUF937 domain-containing protein [Acidobacteriota bacterium]NLH10939.1 DUF937 domain-containing protein [Holophagae bacterium]